MESPVDEEQQGGAPPPRKRNKTNGPRTSRACVHCRKQKMRCEGAEDPPCKRCRNNNIECVFERRADYLLNPEDLAWQNRVDARLDQIVATVDRLIAAIQHQGPIPPFIMGPPGSAPPPPLAPPHMAGPHVSPTSPYSPMTAFPHAYPTGGRTPYFGSDPTRSVPLSASSSSSLPRGLPQVPDRGAPGGPGAFSDSLNYFAQTATDSSGQFSRFPSAYGTSSFREAGAGADWHNGGGARQTGDENGEVREGDEDTIVINPPPSNGKLPHDKEQE